LVTGKDQPIFEEHLNFRKST